MKNSIRFRLTLNFMIVILISVVILEVMLIYMVKHNYYSSLRGNLSNQIKISADMYSRYYSNASLEDNILYNVDAFWNQSNARVEIINIREEIIMDSTGVFPKQGEVKDDISLALKGKLGEWVGRLDGERVMALSYPLTSDSQVVGALRFIASTEAIDRSIKSTVSIFIIIGIFVVLAVGLLSIFLTRSIVVPLKEVTKSAGMMAEGNFLVKSKKRRNDEIGKLSDTLNYMADEIVRKEDLKNDFISSVSHELRTPLTSIMGWAITLRNEKFRTEETLDDGLAIIEKESERLTAMVEDLLDFSKFVSGRMKLEYEEVDPKQLLEDIHKQLMLRANRKEISFTVDYSQDLPLMVSDPNRLRQLFINILDNAFNFTSPGGSVNFQAQAIGKEMVFTVEDSGCGISEEELPMVKEKFYKGKGSASQNGIGLSICQEIVSMMKGTMTISSELGIGTRVFITLPIGADIDA